MFTLMNWIIFALVALTGIIIAIVAFCDDEPATAIIVLLVTAIIVGGLMLGVNWWHKNTANGTRAMRDYTSNIQNGVEREITITAEDGREIFHYIGKIDIETAHVGNANYILFDDENGKRYMIYYGIMDTILIVDK